MKSLFTLVFTFSMIQAQAQIKLGLSIGSSQVLDQTDQWGTLPVDKQKLGAFQLSFSKVKQGWVQSEIGLGYSKMYLKPIEMWNMCGDGLGSTIQLQIKRVSLSQSSHFLLFSRKRFSPFLELGAGFHRILDWSEILFYKTWNEGKVEDKSMTNKIYGGLQNYITVRQDWAQSMLGISSSFSVH